MEARIVLENGEVLRGRSFGARGTCLGEIIFNTNMMGYQELITDPAYYGSIIVMTYPLIGNYGVNKEDMNSSKAHLSGLIVQEYSKVASNWMACDSLSNFMKKHNLVGIEGIDTRFLSRLIKRKGVMKGAITTQKDDLKKLVKKIKQKDVEYLVDRVSCLKPYTAKDGKENKKLAVVVDLGVNYACLSWLSDKGYRVKVAPYFTDYQEILNLNPDLIVLSNGPGNPCKYEKILKNTENLIGRKPLFGLGLGNVILGIVLGGRAYKMKSGHHGSNFAVRDLLKGKIQITAQDHIFDLKKSFLTSGNKVISINIDDGTVEGFQNKKENVLGLNYLP
jgi:carbamoyl-phosphate synthase small subunit